MECFHGNRIKVERLKVRNKVLLFLPTVTLANRKVRHRSSGESAKKCLGFWTVVDMHGAPMTTVPHRNCTTGWKLLEIRVQWTNPCWEHLF